MSFEKEAVLKWRDKLPVLKISLVFIMFLLIAMVAFIYDKAEKI